eukprot:TRINITY_DN4390_c0_g2_i2.p1 TRINITY_DN4390_c0_g2~~TRINITY_DN4390_c0_g2_i2.p1  ORF type:complete len:1022 (-),score=210.52 TRINITY_DN4390_c0_g2_i2:80-3001(-)
MCVAQSCASSVLLLFLVVVSMSQIVKSQDVWFVSYHTGNDTNDGTSIYTAVQNIQTGIDLASDGDTVTVVQGLYQGVGNRGIDTKGKAITVTSMDPAAQAVITCSATGGPAAFGEPAFYFRSGETAATVVQHFTILNCTALDGAGMLVLSSSPTIQFNSFFNLLAFSRGGGVAGYGIGTLTLIGNQFTGCQSGSQGGAIASSMTAAIMTTNTIMFSGTGGVGGGIALDAVITGQLVGNTLIGLGAFRGGMINIANSNDITITDTLLSNGNVGFGTVYIQTSTNIVMERVHWVDSTAAVGGVAYFISSENITMRDCTQTRTTVQFFGFFVFDACKNTLVTGNVAAYTTGDFFGGSASSAVCGSYITAVNNFKFEDNTFEHGYCAFTVIAIFAGEVYDVEINHLTLRNNTSGDRGQDNSAARGGALMVATGSMTVENCTFRGNRAFRRSLDEFGLTANVDTIYGDGGAVHYQELVTDTLDPGQLIVKDSTFEDNQAETGGAVGVPFGSAIIHKDISSCTFKNNEADNYGGALYIHVTDFTADEFRKEFQKIKCGSCKGNKAGIYGDDFASIPIQLAVSDKTPKSFRNLDTFDVTIEAQDIFENRVIGADFVIVPSIEPAKKAVLVGASSLQLDDDGKAEFRLSVVAQFGDKPELIFSDRLQALSGTSFEAESEECRDDEVIIDYPPGSDTFPVCVEASTLQPTSLVKVFWILTGILLGILLLTCIALFIVLPLYNRHLVNAYDEDKVFQFELMTSYLTIVGVIAGIVACVLLIPDPADGICTALPWVWSLCALLVIWPLVAQVTWPRMFARAEEVPFWAILVVVGVGAVLNAIVLIVWTSIDPLELGYAQDDSDLTKQCESEHSLAFIITLLCINGVVLVVGMIVAFLGEFSMFKQTRLSTVVVQNIDLCVTHLFFVGTAVIVLLFVKYDNPDARYIIQSCGFLLGAYVLIILLFFVPFYAISTGDSQTIYTHKR